MGSAGPKVLLLDIETAPVLGWVWGLFEQNVALNQIKADWHVLSWCAKWLKDPASKTIYADQRKAKKIDDDSELLSGIWKLLDEADVVITQNGKAFDIKKLNARFVLCGLKPPSSFRHIDTYLIAKKHFAFTSNKLEYLSDKLCRKFKKLKSKKFVGFDLWRECLAGNQAAWREMELYNRHDVLALEELYWKLIPWDNSINFEVYWDGLGEFCKCGNSDIKRNGAFYTDYGKFQRFRCMNCGAETRGKKNLLSPDKRAAIKPKTNR